MLDAPYIYMLESENEECGFHISKPTFSLDADISNKRLFCLPIVLFAETFSVRIHFIRFFSGPVSSASDTESVVFQKKLPDICNMKESNRLTEKYKKLLVELKVDPPKDIPGERAKRQADASGMVMKKKCK